MKINEVFSVDVKQLLLPQVPVSHLVLPNAMSEPQALFNSMLNGDVINPSSRHGSDTSSQLSGLTSVKSNHRKSIKNHST